MEKLFGRVLIPEGVRSELSAGEAPARVQLWIGTPPPWVEVKDISSDFASPSLARLDRGEREAIQLAKSVDADFLLRDEFAGRREAAACGLIVIGVLGILLKSYSLGLIQNPVGVLEQLRANRFRLSSRLIRQFLEHVKSIARKEFI